MAAFDISAFAKDANVLSVNTAAQGFEMIKLELIDANPLNFFPVEDDLTDLMESIQVSGLMQPLVVCKSEDGRYRVIAGHRRRAALLKLREADPKRWEMVACHVLPQLSESMEELVLIQTNTMAREIDYKTKMEAIKRTEAALRRYQEETGTVLPGRMRTKVAELLKMSEAAVARVKAIDKNLIPELKARALNENLAYAIQQLPVEEQKALAQCSVLEKMASYNAAYWAKAYTDWSNARNRTCNHASFCKSSCCSNGQRAMAMLEKSADSKCFEACCFNCSAKCAARCALSLSQIADDKERRKKNEADEKKRRDKVKLDSKMLLERVWPRIGSLMDARGIGPEDLAETVRGAALGYCYFPALLVSRYIGGEIDVDDSPCRLELSAMQWVTLAKLLGCSLDWLLLGVEDATSWVTSDKSSVQTNFELIKSLTPEEKMERYGDSFCAIINAIDIGGTPDDIADGLCMCLDCDECPADKAGICDTSSAVSCREQIIAWLKSPAEEVTE